VPRDADPFGIGAKLNPPARSALCDHVYREKLARTTNESTSRPNPLPRFV
jgi:hypothetical protein